MGLLLFFALPVATIILAVVLQKILKCPILVAATFFAIYLIVAFAIFDSSFLIFVIVYTILAYISAHLTRLKCDIFGRNGFFKNINAENINTNILRTNEFINDSDNNNSTCNNHCCNNRSYNYNRYYRR